MERIGLECNPGDVVLGDPIPLESAGTGREISERVRAGKAVLEIVSTPWGVEFYVCEVVKQR